MASFTAAPEAILEKLVSFDTVSSKSNHDLIGWVEAFLAKAGLAATRIDDLTQPKSSLFVTVGPRDRGGICLSGHTDVVPVEGQAWTSNPFTLTKRDGKLYGRGSADMKGFLAVCLAKLVENKDRVLQTPIHLVLSYDEETTCEGILPTIARFGVDLPRPLAVIVGEPSLMKIANGHKAGTGLFTTFKGREAHSSKPSLGANTIVAGAMLVAEIERLAAHFESLADPTSPFDPPFTTLHVGIFQGGTARNIVPQETMVNWEIRALPGLDMKAVVDDITAHIETRILPFLRSTAPESHVLQRQQFWLPGLHPEPSSLAQRVAQQCSGSNHTIVVPYGSEAGQFQAAGLPTVICGPGDIAQAHKPDEWIAISELKACEGFLDRLFEACTNGL